MGPGIKEASCPLCGINVIRSASAKYGFEAAHIVAFRFFHDEPSVLYLYPSCSTCNNECEDLCILDFLYNAGRIDQLKRVMSSIHRIYAGQNPDLSPELLFVHHVMDHLYGRKRFPAGGGIDNDYDIYSIARSMHMKLLNDQILQHNQALRKTLDEIDLLSASVIKRKKPTFAYFIIRYVQTKCRSCLQEQKRSGSDQRFWSD